MTKLLTQNSKIKNSSKHEQVRLFNFGIPAFKANDGTITCPLAGTCATGCYAQAGAYVWSNVAPAYEFRLAATKNSQKFKELMTAELKCTKATHVRIHDSGDFYSLDYTLAWLDIIRCHSHIQFYAYTKMVPMFKRLSSQNLLPTNFILIYSFGGKADHLIDINTDRHSMVFASEEALHAAGYVNASKNDLQAITENPRIGLIYHGAKSRAWTTVSRLQVNRI